MLRRKTSAVHKDNDFSNSTLSYITGVETTSFPGSFPWLGGQGKGPGNDVGVEDERTLLFDGANFGRFCSFGPKLHGICVRLHCYVNKNVKH